MPARRRAKEFIRFLKKIDRTVAKHLDLHLDRRQLHDAQDKGSSGVAGAASTLQVALHSDVVVLAEPRRALLRRDHR